MKDDAGEVICITPTRMGHCVAKTPNWVVRQIFAAFLEDRIAGCGLPEPRKARLAEVNKYRVQLARHLCPRERWDVAGCRLHLTGKVHETLKSHELVYAAMQTHDI